MSAAINRNDPAVIAATRARAPGWFALADSVALFSDQLIDRIQPKRDDGQQVLCALLFRRLLSAYQAVIILAEYCVLSGASHHVARDLERHIIVGADDDIEELIWGFEPEPPFKLLLPATDRMLMGVHVVDKRFALGIANNIRQFSDESQRLSGTDETGDG